jgi:hypothetical protein
VVSFDELVEAVSNVLPQLVARASLELLRHAVLGLNDVELRLLVRQGDFANSQVGSAHIQGEESAGLVAIGKGHAPGRVHGLGVVSWLPTMVRRDTMLPPSLVKPG